MRVGLVLGAGGVMGGAWLTGGLHALASETGWDPGSADYLVGTSAGSMMGSLCASGVPPWFMVAHSAGESFDGVVDADGRPATDADRAAGAYFRLHRGWPQLGPGSPRMILATLASPLRHSPSALVTGWLPAGLISTEPLEDTIRRVVPAGWAEHPNLWVVACDYATGARTVFGRAGAPRADLARAVAASCAIPGFYRPVEIGGRRYVDGGVCSPSNLDLLRGAPLDLVICLNPLSTRDRPDRASLAQRAGWPMRAASGRRLGYEAKKLQAAGIDTVLIQPIGEDIAAMGPNLMSGERRQEVIETAARTVAEQLQQPDVARKLDDLPRGEPHKVARPPGPPSSWPQLGPAPARKVS